MCWLFCWLRLGQQGRPNHQKFLKHLSFFINFSKKSHSQSEFPQNLTSIIPKKIRLSNFVLLAFFSDIKCTNIEFEYTKEDKGNDDIRRCQFSCQKFPFSEKFFCWFVGFGKAFAFASFVRISYFFGIFLQVIMFDIWKILHQIMCYYVLTEFYWLSFYWVSFFLNFLKNDVFDGLRGVFVGMNDIKMNLQIFVPPWHQFLSTASVRPFFPKKSNSN